ncbi:MAG: hypothetical protein ABL931_16205 [Usitatibacteraceae bacterium]
MRPTFEQLREEDDPGCIDRERLERDAPQMGARIAELEAALRPFANAYRHAASQPEWLREDMLASMTICGITTDDFVRAADACKADN